MSGSDEDGQARALRLQFGLGDAPAAVPPPSRLLWVAGDLGGAADLVPVAPDSRDAVLAGLGARLAIVLPNLLGSRPEALAVTLSPRTPRDLSPAALIAAVPLLDTALALRRRAAEGATPAALTAEFPLLDKALALLGPVGAPPPRAAAGDAEVDRILGLLDLGEAAPAPAPAGPPLAALDALIARQCTLLLEDPALRRLEAAWGSLGLLLGTCDSRSGVVLRLLSAPRGELAARLAAALDALDPADPAAPEAAILLEAFDPRTADGPGLAALAEAAEAASVPVIAEAPPGLPGRDPIAVAAMRDPGTLFEGPAWGAWRGLRQKEASRWLGFAWNRPWLRNAWDLAAERGVRLAPGTPPAGADLPGAAAAAVGALVARSLARCGWPSEVQGAEMAGPAVAVPPGGRAAFAVEAPLGVEGAASLAEAGLLALCGRADRDTILLPLAQTVREPGRVAGDPRLARHFASLPYALAAGRVGRAVAALVPAAAAAPDPAAVATAALRSLVADTGAGASAEAELLDDPDRPGGQLLALRLRFGREVLAGATMAMEVGLS